MYKVFLSLMLLSLIPLSPAKADGVQHTSIAVMDFGSSSTGRLVAEKVAENLKSETEMIVLDRDLSRVAARGIGYSGSLNLSVQEARDLGAAIGSDFYILGDAQTLRRSPSAGPTYFEAYASIFIVSSRTGKLALWERLSFEAPTGEEAEKSLSVEVSGAQAHVRWRDSIRRAQEEQAKQREALPDSNHPVIEEAPDDEKQAEKEGLRLPRPYRRLRPEYPETAARSEVEAVVDVLVDLDAEGEVTQVELTRWAGFGLDEATLKTVRQLHFFPAMRNGVPVPIRVLLRYNFRKPPKQRDGETEKRGAGDGVKGGNGEGGP